MARKAGWLTVDAIRNGMREEFALVSAKGRVHRVLLQKGALPEHGFVVLVQEYPLGQRGPDLNDPMTRESQFGDDLEAARKRFSWEGAIIRQAHPPLT